MRQRLIRAGGWTMGAYAFTQFTRLLSSLIMTRMLLPEVFGLMAIALVINTGLVMFSDLGLAQSIVRSNRGDDPRFLNTMWTIQILRGIGIWLTSIVLAASIAAFQSTGWLTGDSVYAHKDLPYVIAAVAFVAVLQGFESTKITVAKRQLALARASQLEIGCNVIAVSTTIGWALLDRTIWALVGGWIIAAAVKSALTHLVFSGPNNRLVWDSAAVQESFQFGKWVFLSSILTFVTASADRLILSGLLSAQELGIYSIAYLISSSVQQGLSKLASNVAFPALSEIARKQPNNLRNAYYKIRIPFDVLSLSASGLLFSTGHLVISTLYDPRYASAGVILSILSLSLIGARYAVTDQAFLALGKSKLLAKANALRTITLYFSIPVGFYISGLTGAVWGMVLSALLTALATLYFSSKNNLFEWKPEIMRLIALPAGYFIGESLKQMIAV